MCERCDAVSEKVAARIGVPVDTVNRVRDAVIEEIRNEEAAEALAAASEEEIEVVQMSAEEFAAMLRGERKPPSGALPDAPYLLITCRPMPDGEGTGIAMQYGNGLTEEGAEEVLKICAGAAPMRETGGVTEEGHIVGWTS